MAVWGDGWRAVAATAGARLRRRLARATRRVVHPPYHAAVE